MRTTRLAVSAICWVVMITNLCLGAEERAYKSSFADIPEFGGPSSIGADLRERDRVKDPWLTLDALDRTLEPWFGWKGELNERLGLSFGFAYNALYQAASESAGTEDAAAAGIFGFKGSWTLFGRGTDRTGSFQWNVGHLHGLGTAIAPADLGFESGYLGIPGTKFSAPDDWALVTAAWRQDIIPKKLILLLGFQDPTDYIDVYALENPLTAFQNLVFTVNPTIAAPNAGSLSAVAGGYVTENIYYMLGLADANGSPTSPSFSTFADQREYFYHAEIGLVPSMEDFILDRITLFAWYQDERQEEGVEQSEGLAFTFTKYIDDKWMPFLRAGYSDGNASLLNETVSIGLGRYFSEDGDLLGVAGNWGRPADSTLSDQYTGELFYRVQLAQNLQLTPSVQLLVDPALNPDADQIWIGSVRARFTL